MNRRITAILTVAAAVLSLASCGDKEEQSVRPIVVAGSTEAPTSEASSEPTSEPTTEAATFHEPHDYEDGVLVGRWAGDEADIVLQDNGKVSAEFDISEVMMLRSDGVFMLSGEEFPPENTEYDGTELVIYTTDEESGERVEFLRMQRRDDPAPDSYDGLYDIVTDLFKEKLAGLITGEETSELEVQMRIRRGNFIVFLPEFCEYTQSGDEFSLMLPNAADGSLADELGDSTFVLDGDQVTFYNGEGITEQFKKME
ncbi:MAG: hypothetical protein K6G82_00090 [Ruminococcus sp.]|nr:hypothetical protein [Ruminococcus sp.]